MTQFKIAVTSDTVCPWCFIGHKQVQAAEQLWNERHPDSGDTFTVSYLPFQLQPNFVGGPASSTSKEQFYFAKFGKERTQMMNMRLGAAGKALGINFKFGGQTGSSRDSLRLVQLAKKVNNGVERKVVDALFSAYFEEERDITSYDTLKSIAVEAGISEEDFQKTIVESDEGGREVDDAAHQAKLNGVTGVPDYLIQDQVRLQGANGAESFVKVFETIKAAEEPAGTSI